MVNLLIMLYYKLVMNHFLKFFKIIHISVQIDCKKISLILYKLWYLVMCLYKGNIVVITNKVGI